jgi:antitoxin CptB
MTPAQIAWRCRRGMTELDLLLGGWLREQFERASPEEQAQFVNLLELSDQDLVRCLLRGARPHTPELASAAEAVLANAGIMSRCCKTEPLARAGTLSGTDRRS